MYCNTQDCLSLPNIEYFSILILYNSILILVCSSNIHTYIQIPKQYIKNETHLKSFKLISG